MSYTLQSLKEWIDSLIEIYPPESKIILAKDSEGSEYSPMINLTKGVYFPSSTYSGTVYETNLEAEDYGLSEEEWESIKSDSKNFCITLHPTF